MTMIRRLLTIAAIAAAAATAQAREWSLQECVDYAVANNIDVRSRALEVSSARLDLDDARNRFMPTASGYAGQNFNFGRGLTADNTLPTATHRRSPPDSMSTYPCSRDWAPCAV